MFKLTQGVLRYPKSLFSKNKGVFAFSTTATVEPKLQEPVERKPKVIRNNSIVAAAFASLPNESSKVQIETPMTNSRIENAKTIDELLSISNGEGISRKHALKVVSILADWSSKGNVKLTDFESDPRFIKLCRILTKINNYNKVNKLKEQSHHEDLSTIMNVAADDEAAKLVASFSLPQMVKVIQTLASKQRRSTLLLRSLSFNITKSPQRLNMKQAADLLYSMCLLSFPDENLLAKISNDILHEFDTSLKKSSVIGSILTSLGLLRFKDTSGMVEVLCNWLTQNYESCRSNDLFSLVHTLAILNYMPPAESADQLFNVIAAQLAQEDAKKPNVWLDFIWSLVVLDKVRPEMLQTVLNEGFSQKITTVAAQVKLVQIDAAAQYLVKDYQGSRLDPKSPLFSLQLSRSKDKEECVNSVLDTLKNLMQSESYVRSNIKTNMGFLIDAECYLDKKCTPVVPEKYSPKEHTKVAIMVQDYHDTCRGKVEPTGIQVLQERLLAANGYKVIKIPYHDYRPRDKLVHRVQLIESKLKTAVSNP